MGTLEQDHYFKVADRVCGERGPFVTAIPMDKEYGVDMDVDYYPFGEYEEESKCEACGKETGELFENGLCPLCNAAEEAAGYLRRKGVTVTYAEADWIGTEGDYAITALKVIERDIKGMYYGSFFRLEKMTRDAGGWRDLTALITDDLDEIAEIIRRAQGRGEKGGKHER
jgi:hypothetical protein